MNWLDRRNRRFLSMQLVALMVPGLWGLGFVMAWDGNNSFILKAVIVLFMLVGPVLGALFSLTSILFGNIWLKFSGLLTLLMCMPFIAFLLNGIGAIKMDIFWRYWPF